MSFVIPHGLTWDDERRWAFAHLPREWKNLRQVGFTINDITSPYTPTYNCVAFAAKDSSKWWWPTPLWMIQMYRLPYTHWPVERVHPPTIENFNKAFRTKGFIPCKSGKHEFGYEKVAVYVDAADVPQHMARETGDGVWFSKLGDCQDIRHHVLEGVEEGAGYGRAKYFMRKRIKGITRWAIIKRKLAAMLEKQ